MWAETPTNRKLLVVLGMSVTQYSLPIKINNDASDLNNHYLRDKISEMWKNNN